jgi:predicted transposase YbfD/YdcC
LTILVGQEVVMPAPSPVGALVEHFAELDDPRVERTKRHPLLSIVAIALCGVIVGAESWDEIEEFGQAKAEWFSQVLDLPHGIPSHDTFNRVFAALDPHQFRACFAAWMQQVAAVLPTEVIALDGKTLRRSHDRLNGREAIHLISAWASRNQLVLAQERVESKANEITALPQLLQVLAVKGCLVSIDAIGCQREIAQQILDQGGDYLLALKENQPTLLEEVQSLFVQARDHVFVDLVEEQARDVGKGHGRLEIRRHTVIADPDVLAWLDDEYGWPGLKALGMVEAERRIGTTRATQTRYYLLSRALSAAAFGAAVRSHWGIENQVHWTLDVTFGEDQSRMRAGYAAENVAVLRHLALNLVRQHQTKRLSIKAKRKKAGWDNAYLLQLLQGL